MTRQEFKQLMDDIAEAQRTISNAQQRLHELTTRLCFYTSGQLGHVCSVHIDRLNGESSLD